MGTEGWNAELVVDVWVVLFAFLASFFDEIGNNNGGRDVEDDHGDDDHEWKWWGFGVHDYDDYDDWFVLITLGLIYNVLNWKLYGFGGWKNLLQCFFFKQLQSTLIKGKVKSSQFDNDFDVYELC